MSSECSPYNTFFNHRVWNASACWSNTEEQVNEMISAGMQVIVGKTCTLHRRSGNSGPVYQEFPDETMRWNRMGLPNNGYKYYRDIAVNVFQDHRTRYILSVYMQNEPTIFVETLEMLVDYEKTLKDNDIPVAIVELNISCPNVKDRIPGYHCKDIVRIFTFLQTYSDRFPRIRFGLKLPPYFEKYKLFKVADTIQKYSDIVVYIVCSNTIPNGYNTDFEMYGGISASHMNRMISQGNVKLFREKISSSNSSIKIIGCGGIHTLDHINEYMEVGADVVQLGSGFYDSKTRSLDMSRIRGILWNIDS
jgi:dihydroorotate dehydrogenase